jgi:hypothetical protein
MCDCKICTEWRAETKRREELGFDSWPEEAQKLIRQLDDTIMNLEDDINYKDCIIDGSWPTADEIIKAKRENVKND